MSDLDQFSETELLARVIWGEARGESYEGRQAIANVIMNRAENPRWWGGPDVRSVLTKPYQFSCLNQSDPNRPLLMAVATDDPIYRQCLDLAAEAMSGDLGDVTGGCDSYIRIGTKADWATKLTPYYEIGHHAFYVTV